VLSKKYRLTSEEIEELKSRATPVLQGKFFGLLVQTRPKEKKFSLIISNKVCQKATARNRVKRLFYQALEKHFSGLEGKFLFLAKKKVLEATREDFQKEIEALIRQLARK